jgi:hypothetical protein
MCAAALGVESYAKMMMSRTDYSGAWSPRIIIRPNTANFGHRKIRRNADKKRKVAFAVILVGLEPTISGSVDRCLIHWATGPAGIGRSRTAALHQHWRCDLSLSAGDFAHSRRFHERWAHMDLVRRFACGRGFRLVSVTVRIFRLWPGVSPMLVESAPAIRRHCFGCDRRSRLH